MSHDCFFKTPALKVKDMFMTGSFTEFWEKLIEETNTSPHTPTHTRNKKERCTPRDQWKPSKKSSQVKEMVTISLQTKVILFVEECAFLLRMKGVSCGINSLVPYFLFHCIFCLCLSLSDLTWKAKLKRGKVMNI